MIEEFVSNVKTSELVGRYMALHDYMVINCQKKSYVEFDVVASILGYTDLVPGMEEDA